MANFDIAFAWMMNNEDPHRKYAPVPDVGGQAISGINSHSFPEAFGAIVALPSMARPLAVENFYRSEFWNQWFAKLADDELAKRVFDCAVNMGEGAAVKLLQVAINGLRTPPVTEDGGWGPNTLSAANSTYPGSLVTAFIAARCRHYEAIAAAKPDEARYLPEWLERAKK